jgi:hypothetical protein
VTFPPFHPGDFFWAGKFLSAVDQYFYISPYLKDYRHPNYHLPSRGDIQKNTGDERSEQVPGSRPLLACFVQPPPPPHLPATILRNIAACAWLPICTTASTTSNAKPPPPKSAWFCIYLLLEFNCLVSPSVLCVIPNGKTTNEIQRRGN